MTRQEKLLRDIATLRDSIEQDWRDLQNLDLSKEERQGVRQHVTLLESLLGELRQQLDVMEAEPTQNKT